MTEATEADPKARIMLETHGMRRPALPLSSAQLCLLRPRVARSHRSSRAPEKEKASELEKKKYGAVATTQSPSLFTMSQDTTVRTLVCFPPLTIQEARHAAPRGRAPGRRGTCRPRTLQPRPQTHGQKPVFAGRKPQS